MSTAKVVTFAAMLAAFGCSPRGSGPNLPSSVRNSLNGSPPPVGGASGAGNAAFDAIVVDPNTWQGNPVGSGQFSISLQPPLGGGTSSVAALDPSSSTSYVFVGDFSTSSGVGLVIASDTPFPVGTAALDPAHVVVAAVDVATGNELAQASSGTLTLTAAGSAFNSHVTGTFAGSFQPVSQTGCATDADCPTGEVCQAGTCVPAPPSACRTNADCPVGETCVNGSCVTSPPPACRTDADCPPGEVCVSGSCVSSSPPPPLCATNADCPPGETCQNGQCVGSTGSSCMFQGSGSFYVSEPAVAACSAIPALSISVPQAAATVTQIPPSSGPAIVLFDSSLPSPNQVLAIQLQACPAAPGSLSVGSGVDGFVSSVGGASGHVQVAAQYQAISGSVTFTQVGTTLSGSATFGFDNGGTATAAFTLQ